MFCFRGNSKCVACGISGGVRCTDCTGALKEDLRETTSALRESAALVVYHKGEGLGRKVVDSQAGVKGITNFGSSTGKWCVKISLMNHLLSGHTHTEALYMCPTSHVRPFVTHRL